MCPNGHFQGLLFCKVSLFYSDQMKIACVEKTDPVQSVSEIACTGIETGRKPVWAGGGGFRRHAAGCTGCLLN